MAPFTYRNTHVKPYVDLATAIAGGTPGAGGVTYVNTNPKPYIDAELTEAGGEVPGSGYVSSNPRAYIDAGYDVSTPSAEQAASRLSKTVKVSSRILELTLGITEKAQRHAAIESADVMQGLSEIAFVDIGDLVAWDAEGHVTLTPSSDLSRSQRNAIKKVTHVRRTIPQKNAEPIVEETVSLELEAKKGALDSLAKILGMLREQVDIRLIDDLAAQMGLDRAEVMAEAERIIRGAKV